MPRRSSFAAFFLFCVLLYAGYFFSELPFLVLPRRFFLSPPLAPIVFRFEFGGGGVGDCIKGMVAVMQAANLCGRPFAVDFSRHPFGSALPFARDIIAPQTLRGLDSNDALVFNVGDWLTSSARRARRDELFSALQMALHIEGSLSQGIVVQTNIPWSRELAALFGLRKEKVFQLGSALMASVYERVFDGAALGSLWPAAPLRMYRVAVHLRTGDKFIEHATFNKNDVRVSDTAALLRALANVPAIVAQLAQGAVVQAFACADTLDARNLLRDSLAANMTVFLPDRAPVHTGYATILDSKNAEDDARDTLREHYTLASADALFMLSASGFSSTACATAVSGKSPACFVYEKDAWVSFQTVKLFSLS
jgi:hypothetical protein